MGASEYHGHTHLSFMYDITVLPRDYHSAYTLWYIRHPPFFAADEFILESLGVSDGAWLDWP